MPKNTKGGKKFKRGKKGDEGNESAAQFKDEGQEYGRVVKMLGDCRLDVELPDKTNLTAHIRGKLRKRVWIETGDIVLVSLRDFDDSKGDVIAKYSSDQANSLVRYGEITSKFKSAGNDFNSDESSDEEVAFEEDEFDVDDI